MMTEYRLHPNWHLTDEGTLFNRFSMELRGTTDDQEAYLRSLPESDAPSADCRVLVEDGVVTAEDDPVSPPPEFAERAATADDVTINTVRFYVTEDCNMGCPGCYVRFKYRNDMDFDDADVEKAHKVVDFLREQNEGERFNVQFVGGEPLMRMDLVEETIAYAKRTCPDTDFDFTVTTNATVVDEETAKYLASENVEVGVSIDGWKELNDESRMYMDDEGTYEDTIEGFERLKRHLDDVAVVVTPQPLNVEVLADVVDHLLEEIDPDAITINDPFHADGTWEVDGREFASQMKRIILRTFQEDVPLLSPASQIIRAVADGRPKLQTLPTPERNMTASLSTDGRISYHHLTYDEDLFPNPIEEWSVERFEKWATFSGYQHETCRNCVALNTCGGPDPFESYQGNFDIDDVQLNDERCKFYREMTPWLADRFHATDA